MLLATATRTPELKLEHGEAEALADAIATVSAHYDVGGVIPPEALAWANLAQVCGFIYGPRIMAARMRKSATQAAQQAEANGEWHHGDTTGTQGFPAH